jgi:cation transport protein ChaC
MQITYFGYGSLVNTRTLGPQASAVAGALDGWRREWRAWWRADGSAGRPGTCTLTVRRDPQSAIQGVMVSEPAARLAVLDEREKRYVRVNEGIADAFRCDAEGRPAPEGAFLYEADTEIRHPGDDDHPILQSYVDCVMAGFHAFWGEEGVRRFIATTDGWQAPMLADRASPRYPRAQSIDPDLLAFFDELLAGEGVRYLSV